MPSSAFAINWCKSHFEKELDKGIGRRYPYAVINITSGRGSGVESIGHTMSKESSHPLIWLKKVIGWGVSWQGADPSGSSLTGSVVLGVLAEKFGFINQVQKDHSVIVSVPTPEHANWAIEDFNTMLKEMGKPDAAIMLRLVRVTGIQSTREFLVNFLDNKIPVATDVSRTFLHDMNYHYLAAILYRPHFVKSWQRRTKIMMDLVKEAEALYANEPIAMKNLEIVLEKIAGRIDRTGNVSHMMAKAKAGDPDSLAMVPLLVKDLKSDSDREFVQDVIDEATRYFAGEKRQDFANRLMKMADNKKAQLGLMESDPEVKTMLNSLEAYRTSMNIETLRDWLMLFPRD